MERMMTLRKIVLGLWLCAMVTCPAFGLQKIQVSQIEGFDDAVITVITNAGSIYNSDEIVEGTTNLYYTAARQAAMTLEWQTGDNSVSNWVVAQNYLTSYVETDPIWVAVSNSYALQSWVTAQNYLTVETDPVWVAVSNSYALQSWVTAQNYLTVETDPIWVAVSNDYALQSWVTAQNYLTTPPVTNTTTEEMTNSVSFPNGIIVAGTVIDGTTGTLSVSNVIFDTHLLPTGSNQWNIGSELLPLAGVYSDTVHTYALTNANSAVEVHTDAVAGKDIVNFDIATNLINTLAHSYVNIGGVTLYDVDGSNLHFEVEYSVSADFSASTIVSTTNSQDNWLFFNGTQYQAFPAIGLAPVYQDIALGSVLYKIPGDISTDGIFVRARAYDGTDWGDHNTAFGYGSITIRGGVLIPEVFVNAPTLTNSVGLSGDIAYDDSFFYVCVNTNTWKRATLAGW